VIIYSNLGKRGNLGNQLFQIASTVGIANLNNQDVGFPEWGYSDYFENELPKIDKNKYYSKLTEPSFNYNLIRLTSDNYDLNGWFQSEKYFDTSKTREQFKFKYDLENEVNKEYSYLLDNKNILISVRRGDFVNHPYYFQLSYKYYFLAIQKFFPDWKDRNLIFTSDDIAYCKYHFSFLKNAYFLDNVHPIKQLILGSLCDDYIISNSTFSWWIAWLGEKKDSKIIRPKHNFRGDFKIKNDDSDYFPERWITFDYSQKKISIRYSNLILKGEIYELIGNIKYNIKKYRKVTKNKIKRILGF